MPTKLQDAIVAVLPIALIYFSGWAYLSSYMGLFGIDATQVTIPLPTVFVYAFHPLSTPSVIGFFAAGLFVLFEPRGRLGRDYVCFRNVVGLTFIVLLLFLVKQVSQYQADELAETVWHGKHLQTQMVPARTDNDGDTAYVNYDVCRRDARLQQIIGFGDQTFLLCRSSLTPCSRGTIFVFGSSGAIVETANIGHSPRDAHDCASLTG